MRRRNKSEGGEERIRVKEERNKSEGGEERIRVKEEKE